MGHSRGGEAAILLAEQMPQISTLSRIRLRGVLALAPTNNVFKGPDIVKISSYAFMTILPAADFDMDANPGAAYYDIAKPEPFKIRALCPCSQSQLFQLKLGL